MRFDLDRTRGCSDSERPCRSAAHHHTVKNCFSTIWKGTGFTHKKTFQKNKNDAGRLRGFYLIPVRKGRPSTRSELQVQINSEEEKWPKNNGQNCGDNVLQRIEINEILPIAGHDEPNY